MRKMFAAPVALGIALALGWITLAQQNARPPASWIWHAEGNPLAEAPAGSRYFRKTVTLDKAPDSARLQITADNHFIVWINGTKVGSGDEWETLSSFDVAKQLKAGKNIVAVEGINDSGPAGLVVMLDVKTGTSEVRVNSDATWKSSPNSEKDWQTDDNVDAQWTAAMVLGPWGKTAPWASSGSGVARGPSNPKERFTIPSGFVMEKVIPASATWDGMQAGKHVSFVNCCFDAKGRLLLSQEGGPILICEKPGEGETTKLPVYCSQITNCHGMCWAEDSLFLVGNGPQGTGLYRCTEKNDRIAEVKLLH